MFSKSETYRLDVEVFDDTGHRKIVNPTELAALAGVDLAVFLSGAESWRHAPVGRSFQQSLPGLAQMACGLSPAPARAHIRLQRRANLDAPIESSDARRSCPPCQWWRDVPSKRGNGTPDSDC